MNCQFCLKSNSTTVPISDKWIVIQLHFPFIEDEKELKAICEECWLNVRSFHEYYVSVEDNFNNQHLELQKEVDYSDIIVEEESFSESEIATEWIASDITLNTTPDEPTGNSTKHISAEDDDELKIRKFANMHCVICSTPLESLREAKAHYKQIHNINDGYISCCDRKFRQRCRLIEHVNSAHYNYNYPCSICHKTFDSKAYLIKHKACHEQVKLYECAHCPKSFAKKFQVRNHLMSVHLFDNIQWSCPIENCFKTFVNRARLKHHIDYTHTDALEICEVCSKAFKTKSAIDEHRKTHERKSGDRKKCDICGHFLSDLKSFQRHWKNHSTENLDNFCPICNKKSPNLNALKKHIRFVHEMARNYNCRFCEKTFKRKRSLIDHEAAIHTLQDLYKCSFCPKTFRNQSNMLAHRKKQHPDLYQKPIYLREQV